jgi:hypothetical protein
MITTEQFREKFGVEAFAVALSEIREYDEWKVIYGIWQLYSWTFGPENINKKEIAYSKTVGNYSANFRIQIAVTNEIGTLIHVDLTDSGFMFSDRQILACFTFTHDVDWVMDTHFVEFTNRWRSSHFRKFLRTLSDIFTITAIKNFYFAGDEEEEMYRTPNTVLVDLFSKKRYHPDIPVNVLEFMAKSDVRNLLQLAKTGVPYLMKLSRDPMIWKELFEKQFPGDFAYFNKSVPVLFNGYRYMLLDRDYDFNKHLYDNEWKRYYLWMRNFYKNSFDAIYFDTNYGLSMKIEELTFADECISNFVEMLIESIVFTFLHLTVEEGDNFNRPIDLLIKYMIGLDDNRLTSRFLLHGKRYNPKQLTVIDDPILMYRTMDKKEREQLPYYNPLFNMLIIYYQSPATVISELNLMEYEQIWHRRISDEPHSIAFFKRVSRIWNWRCFPLFVINKGLQKLYSLIYADQETLKDYLDAVRNSELFFMNHRTWENIADTVHSDAKYMGVSFMSQMYTFLKADHFGNANEIKRRTNLILKLALKKFAFSPSIINLNTGEEELVLAKIEN